MASGVVPPVTELGNSCEDASPRRGSHMASIVDNPGDCLVGDPCESGDVVKGDGVLAWMGAGGHSEGFRARVGRTEPRRFQIRFKLDTGQGDPSIVIANRLNKIRFP